MFDEIEAQGVYEYFEDLNSIAKDIVRLKGKTNTLERNVEQTRSEIKNVETGLRSEIKQTAESVSIEVGKAVSDLEIGTVNILRNSTTLDFEDYLFETDDE